jgi:hypothetical protein
MVSNDCRRRDCQLESGTGHGSHLTFARAGVTVTGEAARWDMVGRQRRRQSARLLPGLRFAGLYDIRRQA